MGLIIHMNSASIPWYFHGGQGIERIRLASEEQSAGKYIQGMQRGFSGISL
jgi:hypothetical protein